MTILILDNLDSFTFNLFHQVNSQLQSLKVEANVMVKRNHEITVEEIKALAPSHIIISPGPGHPKHDGDFGVCKDVILADLDIPILGVCLGFQGMVYHHGGKITHAPSVVHGKTSPVTVQHKNPLFDNLPDTFDVMRYHSLMAEISSFPDVFIVTATTIDESAETIIMAGQHKDKPLYGVQFHPESIGTPLGDQLMANFLKI